MAGVGGEHVVEQGTAEPGGRVDAGGGDPGVRVVSGLGQPAGEQVLPALVDEGAPPLLGVGVVARCEQRQQARQRVHPTWRPAGRVHVQLGAGDADGVLEAVGTNRKA